MKNHLPATFLLFLSVFSTFLFGQDDADSSAVEVVYLSNTEMRQELNRGHSILERADHFWHNRERISQLLRDRDEIHSQGNVYLADSASLHDTVITLWELERWMVGIDQTIDRSKVFTHVIDEEIDSTQAIKLAVSGVLNKWRDESFIQQLDSQLIQVWIGTIRELRGELLAQERKLEDTLSVITSLETSLYAFNRDLISVSGELKLMREKKGISITNKDLPALWDARARTISEGTVAVGYGNMLSEIRLYLGYHPELVYRFIGYFVFWLFIALWFKRYGAKNKWISNAQRFKILRAWVHFPLLTAVLMSFVTARINLMDGLDVLLDRPASLRQFESIVSYACLLIIGWKAIVHRMRMLLLFPMVLFILDAVLVSALGGSFTGRILMVLLNTAAIATLCWAIYQSYKTPWMRKRRWFNLFVGLCVVLSGFLAMGIYANGIGAFSMSRMVVLSTFYIMGLGLIIYFINMTIPFVLQAISVSPFGDRVNVVKEFIGPNTKLIAFILQAYITGLWAIGLTRQLNFSEEVIQALQHFWEYEFTVGDVSIYVGNIFQFLITIVVVYFVAQILQVVVRDEVAGRLSHKRGIPLAYGVITRYVILVFGFFMAASALGIPLDRLSFIVGALGVGIGFGLQSVVGNFLAGIIILFERPVRVGDIVKIDEYEGEVKEIGARAIRIRIYEGAEIMVPNYDLMTKKIVNWTLNDNSRRLEIHFAVKPEAVPSEVIALMQDIASRHDHVLYDPTPIIQFKGIIGSAADYRALVWINDELLETDSNFREQVYNALEERGWNMSYARIHTSNNEDRVDLTNQ